MEKFFRLCNFKKALLFLGFACFFISVHAQVPVTSGGFGQSNNLPNNAANGGSASGLGCGGGGANWYGGNGGDGKYGGGGGGAAGYQALNMIGGAGGQGVLVVAFYDGGGFLYTTLYPSGTSLTIPADITQVKAWVIGAGGGGAGATGNDGTSGGGAGAGGIAYTTQTVSPGNVIVYALGAAGTGGVDATNGIDGGMTTATINGITITGHGGAGGQYNNNMTAMGGSFSGGDGGNKGGDGRGISGDAGGGGGGGIGDAPGFAASRSGGNGADAADVAGLFAALSNNATLPLGWKSITVNNQQGAVLLKWETSYELNTLNFVVQYSTDGTLFKNIATVLAANNGTGNKYQYTHQDAAPGVGYYRLQQFDINGKNSYSKMVKNIVAKEQDKDFVLFTNLISNGTIKMQANKNTTVSLVSMEGKLISTHRVNNGVSYINVSNLAKGYYLLKSSNESQKILLQ